LGKIMRLRSRYSSHFSLRYLCSAFLLAGVSGMAFAQSGGTPSILQQDTKACLAGLRPNAPENGVSLEDFDHFTHNAQLLETTVASAKGQPEERESWWDYIAKMVDDQRVADGARILRELQPQLGAIGQSYQVDPEPLVTIFGIETNFGTQLGKTDMLNAWLTRACTETNLLWKKDAYASIRLLSEGVVQPEKFVGSWSGAFGMTQFIPTSFYELAADGDGDGDGVIDLYSSLPDALASTANHLRKRRAKWIHNVPAVIEVRLPQTLAAGIAADPASEFVGSSDRRKPG
jgi:membrane-bound lytic murein transglycosylase B